MKDASQEEPAWKYSYSTSEVSQYYGLTAKGLAFYEDKGLISPARQSNGKYREYSLTDCYHLYLSKLYRSCGFHLNQVVDLINEEKLEGVERKLDEQAKVLEAEARFKELLSRRLRELAAKLKDVPEKTNVFSLGDRPEMYRLYVRTYNDPHESNPEESREFSLWNQNIPIDLASLRYPYEGLLAGASEVNTGIGNVISAEDFDFLGLRKSERVEHLRRRPCLHAIVLIDDYKLNSTKPLRPALEYLKSRGLRLCGDPVTAMLAVLSSERGKVRYDEVWLPVEDASP